MTRHAAELRFRFRGDASLAQQFIPQARVLIGKLRDTMQFGVTTGAVTRRLGQGVTLRAWFVDGAPIAEIDVTRARPRTADSAQDPACVVTPRNNTYPDGADAGDPQTLLLPLRGPGVAPWAVLYQNAEMQTYVLAAGPKGLFATRHPDGVRRGGNIDWRGTNGERLSWYGPMSRYWWDPQDPNTLPRQWVFCMGEVLLDTGAYSDEADEPSIAGGVLGAALWDAAEDGSRFLLVVQAIGTTQRLVRYTITRDETLAGVHKARVGSFQILATWTLADSRTPWFFNASGTEAVHLTDPDNGYWNTSAPEESVLARISIAPSGTASYSTQMVGSEFTGSGFSQIDGDTLLAVDFDGDTEVRLDIASVRYSRTDVDLLDRSSYGRCVTTRGRIDWLMRNFVVAPGPGATRRIMYADLRSDLFIYLTQDIGDTTNWVGAPSDFDDVDNIYAVEVHRAGALLHREPVANVQLPQISSFYHADMYDGSQAVRFYPRLVMRAWWAPQPGGGLYSNMRGWLASCIKNTEDFPLGPQEWVWGGNVWFLPEYQFTDASGFVWHGFAWCEGDRTVVSQYLPITIDDAGGSDTLNGPYPLGGVYQRRAFQFMTRADLPSRVGLPAIEPAAYPGFALGRPIV